MSDVRRLLDEATGAYTGQGEEHDVRRRARVRERKRRLFAAIVGLTVFVGVGWVMWTGLRSAPGRSTGDTPVEEPIYWVDGARPTMDVSKPHTEDEIEELCVPYSPERPDLHICGDVPAGWAPAPEPYFDDEICAAALRWIDQNEPHADVDLGGCRVIESSGEGTWNVSVPRSGGSGNIHVPYDPTGEIPWAAHP
jgi:hypothetical protein